jgi:hypothetical protein
MEKSLTRRGYLRTDRFTIVGKAKTLDESAKWVDVDVLNMAAGGLLFSVADVLETNQEVMFDLKVDTNVISRMENYTSIKLDLQFKAKVKYHMGVQSDANTYGAAITEMSQSKRIQLDELILSIEQMGGMVD